MKTLIPATTLANTDKTINIADDGFFSFAQAGLAGVEVVTLEIDLDGTWTPILPAIELTATSNYIQVAGPGTYRVNKPTTAGAVSVYVDE